jgi:hypothetical protein
MGCSYIGNSGLSHECDNSLNHVNQPFNEVVFSKYGLVQFGNYLLSEERKELFKSKSKKHLKERLSIVHDSDVENFLESIKKSE